MKGLIMQDLVHMLGKWRSCQLAPLPVPTSRPHPEAVQQFHETMSWISQQKGLHCNFFLQNCSSLCEVCNPWHFWHLNVYWKLINSCSNISALRQQANHLGMLVFQHPWTVNLKHKRTITSSHHSLLRPQRGVSECQLRDLILTMSPK